MYAAAVLAAAAASTAPPSDIATQAVTGLVTEVCLPMIAADRFPEASELVKAGKPLTADEMQGAGIPAEARAWGYRIDGSVLYLAVRGAECSVIAVPMADTAFAQAVAGAVDAQFGRLDAVETPPSTAVRGLQTFLYTVDGIGAADPGRGAGLIINQSVEGTPAAERLGMVIVQPLQKAN